MPFYSTKPVVGSPESDGPTGTGLGLSTVQKLLATYGVRFEIDSELNRGTTFSVYIPIAINSPARAREQSSS
jgi:signal transduction histidine kinase